MVSDGRRIGAHLPVGGGHVRTVERAHRIGAAALQVFTDNPSSWHRREVLPDDLPAYRERLAAHAIGPVAIHASYLVNLAGPDEDFYEKSVALLSSELAVAPAFGASFVNVHIGSHKGSGLAAGIERIADGVARAMAAAEDVTADGEELRPDRASPQDHQSRPERTPLSDHAPPSDDTLPSTSPDPETAPGATGLARPMLVLENSAGSGFAIGTTISEIAQLLDAITDRGVPESRIGMCLDTAHAWGAGFDLSTAGGVDDVLGDIDRLIGLGRLVMLHLNDSKAPLGSRSDRHQHIGAGLIGEAGLARIVTSPRLTHVTYILETPGMDEGYDEINLARVRALQRGEPLEPLPPEALDLSSGRHPAQGARDDPTAEAT